MKRELLNSSFSGIKWWRMASIVPVFAVALAMPPALAQQAQSTTAAGPPAAPMKKLPTPIVDEFRWKENLDDILMNRVIEKNDNPSTQGPISIVGFTTSGHANQSKHSNVGAGQTLDFQVTGQDDPSAQQIVITVRMDKNLLAGQPSDRIQTDNISIGFLIGPNTCWQECRKVNGKKECEEVCY